MKTEIKILAITLALIANISCNDSEAEKTDAIGFKSENVAMVWDDYIDLKDALVKSDSNLSSAAAKELASNFDESPRNALKSFAVQIENSTDIEQQRTLFSQMTQQMEGVLESELQNGEIYKQFCPMAFNNEGGYWFSNREEIRNPYFGDKMLKCGKVDGIIKK